MNAAGRSRIDAPEQGRAATPVGKAEEQRPVRLSPLLQLWPFVRRYLRLVIAASAALLVAALATLAIPLAVRGIIDHGFSAAQVDLIGRYFTLMIGVVIVLAGASSSRFYLVTIIGERVVADLRSAVFAHLTRLSPGFFDSAKTGEVLSRLTADTTQIKSAVGASVSIALRNLVLFIGAAAMMVVTSPRLSGFVLGAIPLIVLPLVAFGRAVRRRSRSAQDTLAEASAYAGELIGGVRTLQAFGNEALASARFTASVERAFAAARQATRARAILTAFAIFLVFSSVVLILWVGAQDVMTGAMSPGRLGQFVLYAVFAAGALGELSQVWGEISQASGAAERLVEILAIPADIKAPAKPIALRKPVRGRVQFDHVRFSYPMRPDGPVLDDVSFTVEPGEKVAIVGPSGAGKSTIFHLLLRFYDPTEGSISFDGVDLRDLDPAELRAHLALVSQDVSIFSGSAAENIGFGRPNASRAEIEQAAALAQADEFIRNLPQGFDTALGERGITLSGGQRQRIAIARAILREAPLLLLDEATSALDAESETLVQKALEHSMRGRTTLVIAHRLATVLSCDRILVMDQGRIVEQGHHDQLAAGQGLYARLAKLQFQGI